MPMPTLQFQTSRCESVLANPPTNLTAVTGGASNRTTGSMEPIVERPKLDKGKQSQLGSILKKTILNETTPQSRPMNPMGYSSPRPQTMGSLQYSIKKPNETSGQTLTKNPLLRLPAAHQAEIQHQINRLHYFHTQSPVYVAKPTFKLQDFELLDTLGTGTFGRVYLTKFDDTKKFYAMKVLKKAEVVKLKQVEHIMSEKNILASIRFPFVVDLFCVFQDSVNLYMLLEYVVGGELFTHLRRAGRFTNDMTRFYASEIVLAIEYLHSKNTIYRDLKPENLLVDHQGHIKITDFGFAKIVEEQTWTWTLCGTPEYLAPEIIQSKGHDKAVDWWALGILIFEMLAGYPPFFDESPFGIYEKILAGKLVFPNHFDTLAKDLLKRLLVSDRNKRLGNLQSGSEDVKRHKWFRGVDWIGLLEKRVQAPIIPSYPHPGDTSNFEKYPEILETEPPASDQDQYKDLFINF